MPVVGVDHGEDPITVIPAADRLEPGPGHHNVGSFYQIVLNGGEIRTGPSRQVIQPGDRRLGVSCAGWRSKRLPFVGVAHARLARRGIYSGVMANAPLTVDALTAGRAALACGAWSEARSWFEHALSFRTVAGGVGGVELGDMVVGGCRAVPGSP